MKQLSDTELLARAKNSFAVESEIIFTQLYHLMEIQRRRLYCELQHGSLYTYAIHELGYSEDQAQRRISAMRLLHEFPEIASPIKAGTLTLSNLSIARTLFRSKAAKDFTHEQRLEILAQFVGKTTREVRDLVAAIAPQALRHDSVRPVAPGRCAFYFEHDCALEEKLIRLKAHFSASDPYLTTGELVDRLADLGIETWIAPAMAPDRPRQDPESEAGQRREAFRQSKECVNCKTIFFREWDHFHPVSLGGSDESENRRVLCRACNMRAAIVKLGIEKMAPYLDPRPP